MSLALFVVKPYGYVATVHGTVYTVAIQYDCVDRSMYQCHLTPVLFVFVNIVLDMVVFIRD